MPNIPPNIGVLAFILATAWLILEPAGAFLMPPKKFQIAPPTKPANEIIRSKLGCRSY